jgi:hypothetical protein
MLRAAAFVRAPASRGRVTTLTALLVAVTLATAPGARAQDVPADPHAVQPERPTVATHAGTVAPGWLELEAGVEADRYAGGAHGLAAPLVAKLGVAPRVQLSLFESAARPPGASGIGLGDLAVGLKWRPLDRAGLAGRVAVLAIVKLATGSEAAGTGSTDVSVILISSHELGPVSLDLNAGYTHRSAGARAPRDATLWTVAAGGPFSGAVGWTLEVYGYPATSGPHGAAAVVAVLGGATLLVRPWLALDAGGIAPLTGPQPRALFAGAVWSAGRVWRAGWHH